eukprot:scaffold7085_cov329-Pinguiococcus_pyrenoidosus.AAC.1
MDNAKSQALAGQHIERPLRGRLLEGVHGRGRHLVGVQALHGDKQRARDQAEELDEHLAALRLLDHDRFSRGRIREEGDRRWIQPGAVAEAVCLEEGRLRVGHHRLDVLLEALQARGPTVGEEQHVVEVRVRRLDHALQLGAEGVVVGASRTLQSAGLLEELLLQLGQHLVRAGVLQHDRREMLGASREGPEMDGDRQPVDGILLPQGLDVAWKDPHHPVQEIEALAEEGGAS